MRHTWHVKVQNGLCIISRSDGLVRQSAPLPKLRQQMTPHGVVADVYDDLCEQLHRSGGATVSAVDLTLANSFNRL